MTETPWTPGPWEVANQGFDIYAESIGRYFIENKGLGDFIPDHTHQTNARLIAAAPEMADILGRITKYADAYGNMGSFADEARALLSRIRGEA